MTKKQKKQMKEALDAVEAICMSSSNCKGCPAKIGMAYCVRWSVWATNEHQKQLKKYGDDEESTKEPCRAIRRT